MEDKHQIDEIRARQGKDPESLAWGFAEHLKYTLGVDRYTATTHDRFMALAYAIKDRLINQWIKTQQTHHNKDVKRVYYLSLEFLIGRSMGNNVINMEMEEAVQSALAQLGYSWEELREQEVDSGLGNGGLGRLAACFLDSLASLDYPAFGYGLRYDYGIFKQEIQNGYQVEQPDEWLRSGNPWEIERPDIAIPVHFGGMVETATHQGRSIARWVETHPVIGIAYDMPVVGYSGRTINTLRLWSAKASEEFDFQDFNEGDYVEAVSAKIRAENLTKALYPNDKLYLGKELRLKQQYLFVACSLADIIRRFKKTNPPWEQFPEKVAIQLNDTHPSLAIPELMRLFVDQEGLDWEQSWELVVKSFGYTNHTLMPEALEKWPVPMLEKILPRHLQIIHRINHDFLEKVSVLFPKDMDKLQKMSLIEEGTPKQVRMANLCIVGSHSTNGVAALHTELLQSRLVPDFARMFPERFNNKTNGITQRRWLLKSNPDLSQLISAHIGSKWVTNFDELKKLRSLAQDSGFRKQFRNIKETAKKNLSAYLLEEFGWNIDPHSIFDIQIKRIHEYKRQLLNALHIVALYNSILEGKAADMHPRTFFFSGKAAPGYEMAKLIIKLITNISQVINNDPVVGNRLKLYFLPNYRVSLAERLFPAADVSEQISTAGTEASGTGNMKFMCNGALTIGTLDGANIEIAKAVGKENIFIFGLKAHEVAGLRKTYNPHSYYQNSVFIKKSLDRIFSGCFNKSEPGIFDPIRKMIFDHGDYYMHLADLESYAATQQKIEALYKNQEEWDRKAILNIASAGRFSSDRAIREYAQGIWKIDPCPVEYSQDPWETYQEALAANNHNS